MMGKILQTWPDTLIVSPLHPCKVKPIFNYRLKYDKPLHFDAAT
ncbi:MAG: hypothetical protein ACSLEM_06030 [Candidatus Malihini olakiniferum]